MSEMHVPVLVPPGSMAQLRPQEFKTEEAKLDALIGYAAEVKDWDLLDQAVDLKIEHQGRFVPWWDHMVGVRESPGRGGVKPSQDLATIPMRQAEKDTGISNEQVSRWRRELVQPERYREKLILAAYRKAGLRPEENHRAEGTGENEWFTPAEYIAAARTVMGGIDLDPATHEIAQQTVRAAAYFTAADDGLAQPCHGRGSSGDRTIRSPENSNETLAYWRRSAARPTGILARETKRPEPQKKISGGG